MTKPVLTKYTYGGRSIFRLGKSYYVIMSRHLSRKAGTLSPAYKDSFHFGKTKSKIVKVGRYYIVLRPASLSETQLNMIKRGKK
jgi:hypothetical protein